VSVGCSSYCSCCLSVCLVARLQLILPFDLSLIRTLRSALVLLLSPHCTLLSTLCSTPNPLDLMDWMGLCVPDIYKAICTSLGCADTPPEAEIEQEIQRSVQADRKLRSSFNGAAGAGDWDSSEWGLGAVLSLQCAAGYDPAPTLPFYLRPILLSSYIPDPLYSCPSPSVLLA
jgi:hypothetical protein